jgi:hypothetical protein
LFFQRIPHQGFFAVLGEECNTLVVVLSHFRLG